MKLSTESKCHEVKWEDATFRVRELNAHEREVCYWKGRQGDGTNMGIVVTEALCLAVSEWAGVEDALGQPVPVRRDAIESLPSDCRMALFSKCVGADAGPFVETSSDAT